jgi:very-short-patch-repair endonuclease
MGGKPRKTTEQFIEDARRVHGEKYDYSLVEYHNSKSKVKIICPIHGVFEQKANGHLDGKGCTFCSPTRRHSTETFISNAKKVHGDKYDYSLVDYKSNKKDVIIVCPIHGEFTQRPNNHLNGAICPTCSRRKTTEQFLRECKEVHGEQYDYSLAEYIRHDMPVKIICPVHGAFEQIPYSHIRGCGCNQCHIEHSFIGKNEIKYFQPWIKEIFPDSKLQYKFDELPYIVDVYIDELKLVIEYDEKNHFTPKNKKRDIHRQYIIESTMDVKFYRISDKTFLELRDEHERILRNMS